ncbi:O-acetyltransferase OatA [Flavobacterium columnare]|uniref:Acyltransferase n=2 Tax=Flavobacterium TaxID=237 RepID=A0A2N9PDY1_9FLAO|nr:acyltransferase [Flavobacterium columnare]RVU91822.1 acyltransferase [Flavobacterium columnare]SPE78541.1 O-acetyltransferase OatA [Flavobacterium columnare]
MNRLRELDFLRGIAILLVLLRHQFLFYWTEKMGWIGVDLFFVLSGFLVSGLLFKEYQKHNKIDGKRFLIRRGFKIYPIFYLFYILYLIPFYSNNKILDFRKIATDLLFLQNYATGWGYAYPASWSLAVEEHFYFGLVLSFYLVLNNKRLDKIFFSYTNFFTEKILVFILVLILLFRVISNFCFEEQSIRNFTMTHLRVDALLFGVLISYLYHFKQDFFRKKFNELRNCLLFLAVLFLTFTPFIEPLNSFFVKTIGFTLVYIAFGIFLCFILFIPNVNKILDQSLSKFIVDIIAKIGFCSYSIYVIHTFVIFEVKQLNVENHYIHFILVLFFSCFLGYFMTYYVEKYFLKIREHYFQSK